mmetsp:Transcript_21730/g.56429  ORF Transcript_21730/g.56429 Transcript_21730/m.56429 type:complete len:130 (+) Transcript_21730:3377-3766(+)
MPSEMEENVVERLELAFHAMNNDSNHLRKVKGTVRLGSFSLEIPVSKNSANRNSNGESMKKPAVANSFFSLNIRENFSFNVSTGSSFRPPLFRRPFRSDALASAKYNATKRKAEFRRVDRTAIAVWATL